MLPARLPLRDEDYARIKQAARCAMRHLSPLLRAEVDMEDLVVHGWYQAFRHTPSYESFDEHGYHDCVREMTKYAIYLVRQRLRSLGLSAARVLARGPGFYDPELSDIDAAVDHDWSAIDAALDTSILIAGLELQEEQAVLGNFYLEQLPAVEAALKLGMSKPTFNRIRRRALARLRHERPSKREAKGYQWHARSGRWRAYIVVRGRQKSLGYHPTEAEARQAYVDAKNSLDRTMSLKGNER